jgi:hypothetical protein
MFTGSSLSTPAPSKREISSLEDDDDYLDRPRKKIFTTNPVPPPFVKQRDFAYGPGAADRLREGVAWALEVQRCEEEREAEMRRRRDESLAKFEAELRAKRNQETTPQGVALPRVPLASQNGEMIHGK